MTNNCAGDRHGSDRERGGKYPNETIRLLHERSSCRSFHDRKIEPEVLRAILEAGDHAPTGGNLQPYSIIKIENKATSRKLGDLCEQAFIGEAPVNLVFCIDWQRSRRWAELENAPYSATKSFRHFWISFQDTIIAAQNICTAADAMGLGSVYIGTVIDQLEAFRDICGLPKGVFPVVLLTMGYPKARPKPKRKLGVPVIVHDEKYRELSDEELRAAFSAKYRSNRMEITDERLERIATVCRRVHGEEFARRCIDSIKQAGYINQVQRYFGLHYVADEMPEGNEDYLRLMEEFGFDWFKKFDSQFDSGDV